MWCLTASPHITYLYHFLQNKFVFAPTYLLIHLRIYVCSCVAVAAWCLIFLHRLTHLHRCLQNTFIVAAHLCTYSYISVIIFVFRRRCRVVPHLLAPPHTPPRLSTQYVCSHFAVATSWIIYSIHLSLRHSGWVVTHRLAPLHPQPVFRRSYTTPDPPPRLSFFVASPFLRGASLPRAAPPTPPPRGLQLTFVVSPKHLLMHLRV